MADLDTKYVLVPREPNGKMIAAAFSRDTTGETDLYASIYRAMIAAAPALPKPSDEVAGMAKRLRHAADNAWFWSHDYLERKSEKREKPEAALYREAATLLEALDARVRTIETKTQTQTKTKTKTKTQTQTKTKTKTKTKTEAHCRILRKVMTK